jgi:hypothetical protein
MNCVSNEDKLERFVVDCDLEEFRAERAIHKKNHLVLQSFPYVLNTP